MSDTAPDTTTTNDEPTPEPSPPPDEPSTQADGEAESGLNEELPDDTGHDPGLIESVIAPPVVGFWQKMKGGASLGESLMVAGYKMQLRGDADVIVNVIYEDGVVTPRPANYHSDGTYFETANGERFSARGIGFDPRRIAGKVPVVWGLRASSEVTEPLESPIARARRLGSYEEYEQPSGDQDVAVDIDPNSIHSTGESAVADGGTPHQNGLVVSFREGYEMFGSKVTNEDMKEQETRGKLAALDFTDRSDWKYLLMIILAFVAGAFATQVPSLVSGAASGGGGAGIPLTLGLGVLLA